MKRNQSAAILSILLFSIAIMLSGNVFAADTTPRRVTQSEFDAAIVTVNSKITDITPSVRAIGDVLPDNSIVFWVDDMGQHGLTAWPYDDALSNWWRAKEMAENHGPGWRLPTKYELNLLYLQKDVVGVFADGSCWSSTEYDAGYAWFQNFYDGSQYYHEKYEIQRVRAVRTF